MTGRADSETKKKQKLRKEKDKWMARAVSVYKAGRQAGQGLRKVCKQVVEECWKATGKKISLNHVTLANLAKGGETLSEFNAGKSLLTEEEAEIVVQFAIEIANRGFPLSHQRLREHVDEILRARLGPDFPGVGKNWTDRFVSKHSDRLSAYWAAPLDSARGRAVNPTANEKYYELLGSQINSLGIEQDCMWAADESGFQPSIGPRERVFGRKGKKTQHVQGNGNRENITVIVTVCADGTSIAPAVIFKGRGFLTRWKQDNPTQASLGHSPRGWTDGELGALWIQDFDEKTREKARGRPRLLLVDGHNSHYTRAFLVYAIEHNIYIICYPAHGTHVYQGLDVAVFGVLKIYWAQEKDKWYREKGENVTKDNFLAIYGAAHRRALTAETIKSAFRKTGAWPFDPSVVTTDMMAPSLETSCRGHLPLRDASPVRAVAAMISNIAQHNSELTVPPNDPSMSNIDPSLIPSTDEDPFLTPHLPQAVHDAISTLASTSSAFLVSPSPIQSTSRLPRLPAINFSPVRRRYADVTNFTPETERERNLKRALEEADNHQMEMHRNVERLHASGILNGVYCNRVRAQLAAQEKKGQPKNNERLVGDGMPRLLTDPLFVERVTEHEHTAAQRKIDLKARRVAREGRAEHLKEWQRLESERKKRNSKVIETYKRAVKVWEEERDRAKAMRQKPGWTKPKRGALEKPIPKPAIVDPIDELESDEHSNSSGSSDEDVD